MTGQEYAAYVRTLTRTNATTLTDAQIVALSNVEQSFLAEQIVANVDEGYFNVIEERDLEAGVRNYTYPPDFLAKLRYVSATIGGETVYLSEIDFGYEQMHGQALLEESVIQQEFANRAPAYRLSGTELWLLSGDPIVAVPSGLKIITESYPEGLTEANLASSASLNVPSSNITSRLPRAAYRVLAKKVSIAYKSSKDKPLPLTEDERRLDVDLQDLYQVLGRRNAVRVITAKVPYNDGSQY